MKLKAVSGIILVLFLTSMVMANIATVLASPLESDINSDGKVDIHDLRKCAKAFGSMETDDPATSWDETINWDSEADIAPPYGLIDIFDLWKIAKHYGETVP